MEKRRQQLAPLIRSNRGIMRNGKKRSFKLPAAFTPISLLAIIPTALLIGGLARADKPMMETAPTPIVVEATLSTESGS